MEKTITFNWNKFKGVLDNINVHFRLIKERTLNIGVVEISGCATLVLYDFNQGQCLINGKIEEDRYNKDGETRKTKENKNSEGSI